MGDAVATAIEGIDGSFTDAQKAQLKVAWEAICSAIVTYIQGQAVVNPGSLAINPALIIAPPGVSGGPCSGSGSVSSGTGTVS